MAKTPRAKKASVVADDVIIVTEQQRIDSIVDNVNETFTIAGTNIVLNPMLDSELIEQPESEKDTTWRLLNRVKFEDAKSVYDRLENKYRQFDSDSRKQQGEHAFDLSRSMLKELKAGKITQRDYDDEYARAWRERAELEKGVTRSTAWVTVMNRSLIQECGWTLHEFLECQKGRRR